MGAEEEEGEEEMQHLLAFPQPPNDNGAAAASSLDEPFRYVRVEDISTLFSEKLAPGQLVWVCKSKGIRGKQSQNQQQRAQELFLRARVMAISEEGDEDHSTTTDGRIRVQYPKGSTYACKPERLLPVLEKYSHKVLVSPETPDYRRCAVVHTLPTEHFLEVGSAFGDTVERIYQTGDTSSSCRRRQLLGVDKSTESTAIAKERYPHLEFVECDLLSQDPSEWPSELKDICPQVIAVDINGNRELEAVCQCLKVLLAVYQPRLIICKSRELHAVVPSQFRQASSG